MIPGICHELPSEPRARAWLAGTDKVDMAPGDVFVIETPGGGGYGVPG